GVAVDGAIAVTVGDGSAVTMAVGRVVGLALASGATEGGIVATARSATTLVELSGVLSAVPARTQSVAVAVATVVITTVGSMGSSIGVCGATTTADGAMDRVVGDTEGRAVAGTAAAGCATFGSPSLLPGMGTAWEANATVGVGDRGAGGVV